MKRCLLPATLVILLATFAAAQQPAALSARQFKSGDSIPFEGDVKFRVASSSSAVFSQVTTKGSPYAVTLEFSDPVKKNGEARYLILGLNREKPMDGDVSLLVGSETLAPIAFVDGFPDPTGNQPDVAKREATELGRSAVLMKTILEGSSDKPYFAFLFDLTADQVRMDKTAVFRTRVGEEKQLFHIALGK